MYCGMGVASWRRGRRRSPSLYYDDERPTPGSTLHPGIRIREALDRLQARGPDPRVRRRLRRRGRRRGVAQEALERGDDGGRLLRGGGRGDDLELRAAVGHGVDDASARVPWVAMPPEPKPRLRGVFHQWAFFVSLVAGAVLVAA